MNPKLLFIVFAGFVGGTWFSRLMEGAWLNAGDVAIMNSLTVIRSQDVLGLFSIPWINIDFFTIGIPKLIQWDYPFFGGTAAIVQYMLYALSLIVVWTFLVVFAGVIYSFIKR